MSFLRNTTLDESIRNQTVYSNFTLDMLAQLIQVNENARKTITNLRWIKAYCDKRKLALVLPILPSSESKEPPAVYFKNVLEGLNDFYEAIKAKKNISCSTFITNPKNTREETTALYNIYVEKLKYAKNKNNYLAIYLYCIEMINAQAAKGSSSEFISQFSVIEQNNFPLFDNIDKVGSFLKAEIYANFAHHLQKKLHQGSNQPQLNVWNNESKDYVPLIQVYAVKALELLKDFEDYKNSIDQFTLDSLVSWREKQHKLDSLIKELKEQLHKLLNTTSPRAGM